MTENAQRGPAWRLGLRTINVLPEKGVHWTFQLKGSLAVADEAAPPEGLEAGLSPWPRSADRRTTRARSLAWTVDFERLPVEITRSK